MSAYIETAPITSTSQADGISSSPIIDMVRQVAQPKLSCSERQHWIAEASHSFSSIQRLTASVHFACFTIWSRGDVGGDRAVAFDATELLLEVGSSSETFSAAKISSERSAVTTVSPDACSSFSE